MGVSPTSRLPLTPGKNQYPLFRRLGGPQGRSVRAENLVHTGIRPRTFQRVVSRCTDWATRPIHDKVKGLIMKPLMAYRATAFTNHGQINICCLSVTSLLKAWLTDTVCPKWFPNCFYGTWRNNSNRRPRNSVVLFFDKELLSGHDVHSCSAQSL